MFYSPITKLGEDLILVLVDAGGNETARAGALVEFNQFMLFEVMLHFFLEC